MTLAEIYPERHKPFIDTGVVHVIERPERTTAFVRYHGVTGIGKGNTKDEALANAWHDAGKYDGVTK